MSRLKLLPNRDLVRVAEAADFEWIRRRGSHSTFRADDGRVIVIPDHGKQVIVRPLLRKVIRDMGLTVDEYNRFGGLAVAAPALYPSQADPRERFAENELPLLTRHEVLL